MLDFFFDLRRAIVFPPTGHSKKERPRPIASEEARQSPSRYNRPGRMNAVRLLHTCSIKTGGFFQRCNIIFPVKPGMSKSSHSKIAVYLHFWVLMATQNSTIIYFSKEIFSIEKRKNFPSGRGCVRIFSSGFSLHPCIHRENISFCIILRILQQ